MNPLVPFIWAAGIVHLAIGAANWFVPGMLNYRENLQKVPPIIREIFIVHSIYIVLVLISFSLLCFLFAPELAGQSPLGKFLSVSVAVFWLLRIPIQIFYYDAVIKRQNRSANVAFTLALCYLGVVFAVAALGIVK